LRQEASQRIGGHLSPQNENVRFVQSRNVRFHRLSARDKTAQPDVSPGKPNVTLAGTVEKIIPAIHGGPEKVQISVQGADPPCQHL
jgi:hypothetical protein